MSQKMQDRDFEWLSKDECRDMELLMTYADKRIAILDIVVFDHRENNEKHKSFIINVDLEYPPANHERDDDYVLALELMII